MLQLLTNAAAGKVWKVQRARACNGGMVERVAIDQHPGRVLALLRGRRAAGTGQGRFSAQPLTSTQRCVHRLSCSTMMSCQRQAAADVQKRPRRPTIQPNKALLGVAAKGSVLAFCVSLPASAFGSPGQRACTRAGTATRAAFRISTANCHLPLPSSGSPPRKVCNPACFS